MVAKIEVALVPVLTIVALAAPRFVMSSAPAANVFYLLFFVAVIAHVHGMFALKKEKKARLFWTSCATAAVWLGLSFAPIWFAHTALAPRGVSGFHRHTFWELPHVH